MSIKKNGIITSPNIYESSAMNLHYETNPGDRDSRIYTFTPSTENNSCMRDIIVHGELYPANELMHAIFKVKWSGFDTSNTSGDFNIFFQGYYIRSDGTTNWWTSLSDDASNRYRNLKSLVLSSTSGEYIYNFTFRNHPYTTYEGIRSDYSNGTGTIEISDFIVIPEKYYIPETFAGGTSSLHIGKDYISAGEIYEI